ncbi:hypothetical protein Egran_06295 [Elaphomyces granulatus]|uniref:FAM86 N-terminal domain-containing protein n=1 Tax=Elaphomyces granulatus TaxID=519963 RepID=A0A232LPJ7_9EURO|nr:hypothetical protein Egran_06295 [Elaphomyces granulatus]
MEHHSGQWIEGISQLQLDEEASLGSLIAQYFQLVEPQNLQILPGPSLKKPVVQAAIYEHMFNEAVLWPIPPATYRTRVLKMIISRIEESFSDPEEDEILDDLFRCWSDLSTRPQLSALDAAQKPSYVRYTAPNVVDSRDCRTVVTLESRGLILSSGTTGFRTWEAALHLGTFLCTPEGESIVRGKRVIELGAGTGFLSMFCAKHLGADGVLVTDRNPALISTIDDCVAYNHVSNNKIRSAIWDWGDSLRTEQALRSSQPIHFDVALGADLLTLWIPGCTAASRLQAHIIPFQSPPLQEQSGFFHTTNIPIRTYRISRL